MAGNETTAFQWETDLPETGLFKAKVLVALAAVILVRYIVSGVDMLTHR